MSVNPLATPKGLKLLCELCQKPAHVQCTYCRVTYYCDEDHQREDWLAIHQKICGIVSVLRSPLPHASSQEEREHYRHQQTLRKTHIIELALQEGKRFLHEGEHALAIPAALEALKFLTELHGGTHIQLTPAYLILAEAAIGLGRLAEADQYLSQAQWTVLKSPDCDPWLRSQLHRNLGQLAAAKNSFTEARKHFAEDIYQSSVAYGPHATQTSGGYYHLGKVFLRENKPDIAISLHDQVVAIWHTHLSGLVQSLHHVYTSDTGSQTRVTHTDSTRGIPSSPTLDVAERAEACHMLHSIRELHEEHTTSSPQLMSCVYHTLAMLHCTLRETAKSNEYAQKALALSSGSEVDNIETLLHLLKIMADHNKPAD